MIGQMSPVTQRQRRWGTGIRVFHIDPVQTQQGKLHRKRPRRATVGAGKNLVKAGPGFQRVIGRLPPVVKISGDHHGLRVGQGIDPVSQHSELGLTVCFTQTEMHAHDMNWVREHWRHDAAVEDPALFTRADGHIAIFIMFNGITRQHRVTVMPLRVHGVTPVGEVAPHGVRQKFVVGGIRPVLNLQRVSIVRAHNFLQAHNICTDRSDSLP